jgi:hypothetical protein
VKTSDKHFAFIEKFIRSKGGAFLIARNFNGEIISIIKVPKDFTRSSLMAALDDLRSKKHFSHFLIIGVNEVKTLDIS